VSVSLCLRMLSVAIIACCANVCIILSTDHQLPALVDDLKAVQLHEPLQPPSVIELMDVVGLVLFESAEACVKGR